ncbi:DMT family transporter [Hydromonas duriensis]|uniref:Drug/metabolite transporter (DMT)-like permease n=1 Tax=Hydromonas duriensis TaxID=1527608 RepID=A0A4R6Y971_9BURK|nr:DMT family transporter [Hydromonas duriensis]TDR31992.1 drug/metabolite transporter (DMT)-like permease [Hydromonas duriensis]
MPTSNENKSFWLGFTAVAIFAITLPMTKWAMGYRPDGSFEAAFSPLFIAFGRAAVAGVLSVVYLFAVKAKKPTAAQIRILFVMALGNVFGFPIFQTLGLLYVTSAHAAVFNGILPLLTAILSALIFRQKPSFGFWLCATLGGALVMSFALFRTGTIVLHWGDFLILLAILLCAMGYAFGAKLSQTMPAPEALCWMLTLSLPITVPASFLTWPEHSISATAWSGFAYLSIFSMWFGMMVWYHALTLGGAVRVSQVQLLQSFMSIALAAPLLNETIDGMTIVFACAVVSVAFIGKKMPLQTKTKPLPDSQTNHTINPSLKKP